MPDPIYEVVAQGARYWFLFLMVLITWRSWRWYRKDRRQAKKRRKLLPDAGFVGEVVVLEGGDALERGMIPEANEDPDVAILLWQARKHSTALFGRRISEESLKKAVAVAVTFLAICLGSTVLLLATNDVSALDAVYETVSATATVGLSRNLTPSLNAFGKLLITATMYFGRVGPISLAVALGGKHENQNSISEPTEEVSIG